MDTVLPEPSADLTTDELHIKSAAYKASLEEEHLCACFPRLRVWLHATYFYESGCSCIETENGEMDAHVHVLKLQAGKSFTLPGQDRSGEVTYHNFGNVCMY